MTITVLSQVQSAFAIVQWENTIEDEFEGLATLLNNWVPDADDLDVDFGDSSARRRRRQAEITSPLPPGHYRPQLFRCNETQRSHLIPTLTQVQRDEQANLLDRRRPENSVQPAGRHQ